ncbi:MAG: tetratricopeptide repeat protein [Myxococcota bacterium]|nr:tetratricopeptide repeat protein [Myxococcota bacterium]
MFPLALMLCGAASAAPELVDYRTELGEDLAQQVASLNRVGRYRDAIKLAGRIQRGVARLAPVAYEAGYAHYRLGEFDAAVLQYDAAIRRDPSLAMAHYDRGEIHLKAGRIDLAEADFNAVVHLTPDHWAGHFRMAHLAGLAGDPIAFEEHLMLAIRHGFDLEMVIADPDWIGFTQHERVQSVLRRIAVLYGSPSLRKWVGERK